MPAKKYHVFLSDEERSHLEKFVSTGTDKARRITRARILLLADESEKGPGKTDKEVSEALGVCMRTVAKTRECFVENGLEALNDIVPVKNQSFQDEMRQCLQQLPAASSEGYGKCYKTFSGQTC
jgi:hypothetical protein